MSTPGTAVTLLAARQIRRGTLIVALAAGGMSAIVAGQYRSVVAGPLDESALLALAANPAIRVLFGPPVALDDPGGFTVWRTGTPVLVLVAVWALLAATRLTRGEEDAGRGDLLLAGRLRLADLTTRSLGVVAAGAVVIAAAVAAAMLAAGTQPAGALTHATGLLGVAVVFAAAGTLAAQLLPSQAASSGAAVALLGVGLLTRMLADGLDERHWLAWLSPFGLTARSLPYAGNRTGPLAVLAVAAVVLALAAVVASRHRDVGNGLLTLTSTRRPRTRLLRSLTGFAVRRARPGTAGWAVGLAAYFLLIGSLTASIIEFLDANAGFADLAAGAGFSGLDTTTGFAASMYVVLTIPLGLYAATRIAATAADERDRRWTPLLALPVSRTRLALTDVAVTAAGVVILAAAAGLALWAGAAMAGAPLTLGAALAGALNTVPVAALSLGAATLAFGVAPRAVAAIGALPVAGGFLLQVVAQSIQAPAWIINLSPYTHLVAVPHTPPDWTATGWMIAGAAVLTALGVHAYTRRDLTT